MKFIRMIMVHLGQLEEEWASWSAQADDVQLAVLGRWEKSGGHYVLLGSQQDVTGLLDLGPGRQVRIPAEAISSAEAALEWAANLMAVFQGTKRRISSPMPCAGLLPENEAEREFLEGSTGIATERAVFIAGTYSIPMSAHHLVLDRLDGVAILAEALAQDHPNGRFHEFVRLFERAFGLSSTPLVVPLTNFLEGAKQEFSPSEVEAWVVQVRHPATHADRREDVLLERGIRPVVQRMKEACYDVLLNKAEWRSRSAARRDGWEIPCGSLPDGGMFFTPGEAAGFDNVLVDDFGAYPMNLEAGIEKMLSEGLWTTFWSPPLPVKKPDIGEAQDAERGH